MGLLRRPLAEDDFWSLVAVMEGRVDAEALERLTAALRNRSRRDVVAFQERLARVLYELDREVLADQPVRFGDEPEGVPIPLSDDSFLYLRAGIVARGRETYRRVLADPSLLAEGVWDESEDLLHVAEEIVGDDIDTKVSYETGSNGRHWTQRPEAAREPWDQGPRAVVVDCRDLSQPLEGQRYLADGRVEPLLDYLPPRYLSSDAVYDLSTDLARLVATNGGLPGQLATDRVVVDIDFGVRWELTPEVGEPRRSEFDDRELPVRAAVALEDVRSWTADQRRAGLAAVAAICLLAVLPEGHPARSALDEVRRAGAHLLPAQ